MVAHISAILFPAIIIYYAVPGSSLFSWHPTLMSVGISMLMLEAIVIFSKSSSLSPNLSRPSKAAVHYWLMRIGMVLISLGLAAIYVNKERNGKPHFTSWHGFLGVLTVGYLFAQSLGGTIELYYKQLSGIIKVKLADLKLYHATSGLLVFTLSSATLFLALFTQWAEKNIHWVLWYVCFSCISSSLLVVMMHVTSTFMPQTMNKKVKK